MPDRSRPNSSPGRQPLGFTNLLLNNKQSAQINKKTSDYMDNLPKQNNPFNLEN